MVISKGENLYVVTPRETMAIMRERENTIKFNFFLMWGGKWEGPKRDKIRI